jgi:hypothetical protein
MAKILSYMNWKILQYVLPILFMLGMFFYLSGCIPLVEEAGERLVEDVLMEEYNNIKKKN